MPIRAGIRKLEQWFVHLLHLDDSPHSIAMGVAVGMFIALTPLMGIQMALTVAVSWMLRCNKVAGVPLAWITNPVTAVPIYSFNYWVGWLLVGGPTLEEIRSLLTDTLTPETTWGELVRAWLALMLHAGLPLWVGCIIVGAVAAALTYVIMLHLITRGRARHRRHLAKVAARKAAEEAEAAARAAAAPTATAPTTPESNHP